MTLLYYCCWNIRLWVAQLVNNSSISLTFTSLLLVVKMYRVFTITVTIYSHLRILDYYSGIVWFCDYYNTQNNPNQIFFTIQMTSSNLRIQKLCVAFLGTLWVDCKLILNKMSTSNKQCRLYFYRQVFKC